MTCLNERIAGVVFFVMSGYAFAGGPLVNSPETMTVASIERMPMELGSPIPQPLSYLHRYEMEFQATQGRPSYAQVEGFYSAQVMHEFRLGTANLPQIPTPPLPQHASEFLPAGQSTAPQLSIVELPNPTLVLHAQPQRRLSLTVDDWVFSGTARVAALGARSTGATLSVRHGF